MLGKTKVSAYTVARKSNESRIVSDAM